jgi:hypothetical protein
MNSDGNVIKRIGLTARLPHATVASMIVRAACSVVVAAALAVTLDAQQAPWFGTWQLEQPQTASRFETPVYKKVTLRIEPWQDGLRVVYDMVRTRGGITHVEWQGRFDGRDYPVQGMDYYLTNAYRTIDARSYEIAVTVDTRMAATATAVVSPDGGTLTVTTVEKDARGRTVTSTAVYRKQ